MCPCIMYGIFLNGLMTQLLRPDAGDIRIFFGIVGFPVFCKQYGAKAIANL